MNDLNSGIESNKDGTYQAAERDLGAKLYQQQQNYQQEQPSQDKNGRRAADYHQQHFNNSKNQQQTTQYQGVDLGQNTIHSSLTAYTVSEPSIAQAPKAHTPQQQPVQTEEDYQGPLNEIYSPGQLYPAESGYDPTGYQENRTQFAPRQIQMQQAPTLSTENNEPNNTDYRYLQNAEQQPSLDNARLISQQPVRFLSAKQPSQSQQSSTSLQLQPQGSQSSLMKQFSDKIKVQAERLQKLEAYKKLCENRILDLDPTHTLPVTENMLGSPRDATRDPVQANQMDYKRQLAIKEQDLVYAKQRAEKSIKENEYLRQELQETTAKLNQLQSEPPKQSDLEANKNQKSLLEHVKYLEEEKNALLDYIEESVNQTKNASALQQNSAGLNKSANQDGSKDLQQNAHRMTLNDMQSQISELMAQKSELEKRNDDLMMQLDSKIAAQSMLQVQQPLSAGRDETFRNLPTGLSARSPTNQPQLQSNLQSNNSAGIMSQGTLNQVQSIDYMVLDLNQVKQELMETQNQFNSTQNQLNAERQDKQELLNRLQDAQSRIVDLEQLQLQQQPNNNINNPWNQTGSTNNSAALPSLIPADYEYKVKLVEERDRLLDQKSELHDKISHQKEENLVLKTTLDETQQELENLVNEHEKVTAQIGDLQSQLKEAQELPRRLRQEAQGIYDQLDERSNEVRTLQEEIKNMSAQAETNMDTLKQLKAHNLKLEGQIIGIRDQDNTKVKTHAKQWESTIDDLTKELQDAQATIVERDTVFQKVERELRLKLHEVEDAHSTKSQLLRRIEDLNHEVRQLQSEIERKDSSSKEQARSCEHLQFEIQRLEVQVQKVSHEKEHTQELRKEDFGVLELTQQKVEKQTKVINKICRDVSKVQELINQISKEFQLTKRILPETNIPTQDVNSSKRSNQLEEQLREANGFLKQIGDWLVSFAKNYKHSLKRIEIGQTEIDSANHQIKMLEQRCMITEQEQCEAREHGKILTVELQALKTQHNDTQTLQKDGYDREERIHKKNQQLKTHLDAVNIQKEKLSLQLKTLLSDKESLSENLDLKIVEIEEINERSKMHELQVSQLIEQKQSVLDLFTRFKEAFPSESLRTVFGQIIEVVKSGHDLDQDFVDTENDLLIKEGHLRKYAKREVEGLLSTKVINIRKEVEKGRHALREMHERRDELNQKLNELELELKQNEHIERRRGDVALETETNLSQIKEELQEARKELIFIQRNRNDLEIALKASQQEREMIQRELLTLRHQLKLKADLQPDAFKNSQSNRNFTSYQATQSSEQHQRVFSGERMSQQQSIAHRHRESQPSTAQYLPSSQQLIQENPQPSRNKYQQESIPIDPSKMPLKRRFPSQEPAIYTQQNQQENSNSNNMLVSTQMIRHNPIHSDLPLQMPNLNDRAGEKMKPSIYGGVMSGPAAQTQATVSLLDNKPPSARQSARPPTYQSTQSASKRSTADHQNSIADNFNQMPQKSRNIDDQYRTGNFANVDQHHLMQHHDTQHQGFVQPSTAPENSVQTLRNTLQKPMTTRSNSMTNLNAQVRSNSGTHWTSAANPVSNQNANQPHHNSSQVASGDHRLQPIISQYGGEITSRSGKYSPGKERYEALLGERSHRESPLRSSRNQQPQGDNMPRQSAHMDRNSLGVDDSKLDPNAYMMQHMSTQKSASGYGGHRSSVNESSIHNKLSALRNVFSQIRQNLDETSMTVSRTNGHHSSMDHQSLLQNQDYC